MYVFSCVATFILDVRGINCATAQQLQCQASETDRMTARAGPVAFQGTHPPTEVPFSKLLNLYPLQGCVL